jgi:hypothetical protein
MKMWGGRFSGDSDERMAEFTRSIDFDQALALDDIDGSIAHVHGLGRANLLSAEDVKTLVGGLEELRGDIEAGRIEWDPTLEDGCTPGVRATTRSPPTSGSGSAGRSTAWTRPWSRWSDRWLGSPIEKVTR